MRSTKRKSGPEPSGRTIKAWVMLNEKENKELEESARRNGSTRARQIHLRCFPPTK